MASKIKNSLVCFTSRAKAAKKLRCAAKQMFPLQENLDGGTRVEICDRYDCSSPDDVKISSILFPLLGFSGCDYSSVTEGCAQPNSAVCRFFFLNIYTSTIVQSYTMGPCL